MVNPENVRVVKLISGEEFFADVEEQPNGDILVKDPITMTLGQTQSGTLGANLDHWLGYTEKTEVRLKGQHVMYCEPPLKQFVEVYIKQFNKIAVPNPGGGIITPGS